MVRRSSTTRSRFSEERNLLYRRGIFLAGIIFAAASFVGIYHLIQQPFLRIGKVDVVGTHAVSPEKVASAVQSSLAGTRFGIAPRDLIFWYPKKLAVESVYAQFPRIETISLDIVYPESAPQVIPHLMVSVREHVPERVWCPVYTSKECMYMTVDGLLYDSSPVFSRGVYPLWVGGAPIVGGWYAERAWVLSVAELSARVEEAVHEKIGAYISYVEVTPDLDVRLWFENWYLVVDPLRAANIEKQVVQILDLPDVSLGLASASSTLDYIDLRFPDKGYYRFASSSSVIIKPE